MYCQYFLPIDQYTTSTLHSTEMWCHPSGPRDRALIGTMLYTFARVSAALKMNVADYFQSGKRSMSLRLKEKGGKPHSVPAHLALQQYLDAYIDEAGIAEEKDRPLFRTVSRSKELTENRLIRQRALEMD